MWKEIVPGVQEHRKLLESGWSLRTIAVELKRGGHAVFSPTRGVDPGDLDAHYLVSPNHYHYLGVPEWSARYPDARIVATHDACPRLQSKLDRPVHPLGDLESELDDGTRLLVPEGTSNGEVWVEIDRGSERTWIVCDAFFNEPKNPSGFFGFGCRMTGTTPGLRIGNTWLWMHLGKRAVYKQWLEARLAEKPVTRLVCSHGDVIEHPDLGARLLDLAKERLS